MKSFEQWLATGPLAGQFLSEEERNLMKIAYLEGAGAAMEHSQAKLASLLRRAPVEQRPA